MRSLRFDKGSPDGIAVMERTPRIQKSEDCEGVGWLFIEPGNVLLPSPDARMVRPELHRFFKDIPCRSRIAHVGVTDCELGRSRRTPFVLGMRDQLEGQGLVQATD